MQPAESSPSGTRTTSWTCRIVVAGKSGTAEFGMRDKQGRLPFHNWFAAFVPKDERKVASDPLGTRAVAREDSDLVVLAFLNDTAPPGTPRPRSSSTSSSSTTGCASTCASGGCSSAANF